MLIAPFIVALHLITFYPVFAFAESPPVQLPPPQQKSPYKVTGVACLEGEFCSRIEEGEYRGYYIKSNIPLNDPRIKRIRGNMFTKAVLGSMLKRQAASKDEKIGELRTLAQSCQGDLCTARWDDKGCNACALNYSRAKPVQIKGPGGATAIGDPHPDAIDDIYHFCRKRGCIGNETVRARRAGTCLKYGPNPLPPVIGDNPPPRYETNEGSGNVIHGGGSVQ